MTTTITPPCVEATGLWKRYGERYVVRDVSIDVRPGEVLGLVGPNGSGKTTSIRMLLNIIRPTSGEVRLFGGPMDEQAQARIGYLPEERGLYQGLRVLPTLVYLAELKGLDGATARKRAEEMLERVGMAEHAQKKVRELSRGMGQLIQFAATIVHSPAFIVLDEPFSGLDPVNARLMKEVVTELGHEGAAIMFSTHQMTDVEELCDTVTMINQGEVVLDGALDEIKRRFADDAVYVETDGPLPEALRSAEAVSVDGRGHVIRLRANASRETLLRELLDAGARLERFQVAMPSLEDIFLKMVTSNRG